MRGDKFGGKRTNWLLIKHRDANSNDRRMARACSSEDRSVASGRTMQQIADGTGKRPKPFMLATTTAGQGRRGLEQQSSRGRRLRRCAAGAPDPCRREGAHRPPNRSASSPSWCTAMPQFIEPQLSETGGPAAGPCRLGTRGQIRRLSRAASALKRAEPSSARARVLTGPNASAPLPRTPSGLPDCIIDGEIVALDEHQAAEFRRACRQPCRRKNPTIWCFMRLISCSRAERICGRWP